MAETVVGLAALERRLNAISTPAANQQRMKVAASFAAGQMKAGMASVGARGSGHVEHTIQPGAVTPTMAAVMASRVIRYIDEGTGLYGPRHAKIVPKTAKALAFHSAQKAAGMGAKTRLTGRMTKASVRKFGGNADMVVVRSVKGMKPRPFIDRAIAATGAKLGLELSREIVDDWNKAA